MKVCKACRAENFENGKFCMECGRALEQTAVSGGLQTASREDIDSMLREGFRLIHEGKLDEARFIAESVLASHSQNATAHSLKGMCYEQRGDFWSARREYEEVVSLRPESAIDRLKLAQLRRLCEGPAEYAPESNRGIYAIFSATAAALVVIALGIVFALRDRQATSSQETLYVSQQPQAQGFKLPSAPVRTAVTPPVVEDKPAESAAILPKPQNRPQVGNPMGGLAPLTGKFELTPTRGGKTLPNVSNSASNVDSAAPKVTASKDPDLIETKQRNPGRIVIEPSREVPANTSDPAVSDNTYRVAQQKMAAGDYRGAIRDFTAALDASRKKALIHQLIGRCYARIGDAANARIHFQTAMQMYEQAGATNQAKACKRELDLLG